MTLPVADALDFVYHRYADACVTAGDSDAIDDLRDRLTPIAKQGDPRRRAAVLTAVLAAGGE